MALSLRPLNPDFYPPGVFQIPLEARVFRVGRGRGNDLQVNHASVSALHAKLEVSEESGVDVIDCGSSNGTFLNGIKVKDRRQLAVGDLLRFATAEFRVTSDGEVSGKGDVTLSGTTGPVSLHVESDGDPGELLRDECERIADELAVTRAENAQLREQIEIERQTILVRDAEIRTLTEKRREQDEAGRQAITSRDAENAALTAKVTGQEELFRRLNREIDDYGQREQRNQTQLSETRKTLMDREGSIAALQYEITKRDGNLRQLGEQHEQLRQLHDQNVAVCKDLKAELELRNVELSAAIEAKKVAEATTAGVVARLFELSGRLLADWSAWWQISGADGPSTDVDCAFSSIEEVASRIRGELDLIEPIWHQFGEGVQAELRRRCDLLREEKSGLTAETEARRIELATVTEDLEKLRELVDTEVRRAQGLSRRGTEIEIPERFEAMIIARDREQELYRSLIERLEVLDRLLAGYRGSRKLREVVSELEAFRARLVAILDANGVQAFEVPIRTMLTLKHRKEVQILSRKGWGTRQYSDHPFQPGEVVKVIRPGYRIGEGECAVVLRKAEVLIRGIDE